MEGHFFVSAIVISRYKILNANITINHFSSSDVSYNSVSSPELKLTAKRRAMEQEVSTMCFLVWDERFQAFGSVQASSACSFDYIEKKEWCNNPTDGSASKRSQRSPVIHQTNRIKRKSVAAAS
jgi:hypothetical protein